MRTLAAGTRVLRRTPLAMLPMTVEGVIAAIAVAVGVFPRDAEAVAAGAVFPLNVYFDLKQSLAVSFSWSAFAATLILSSLVRSGVLATTLWLADERLVPVTLPWVRAVRLTLVALAALFPAAVLMYLGVALRYGPFIWIGALAGFVPAVLINRRALVDGLFEGKADLGNDSPFAPAYPFTDKSLPQRQQDVAQAKQLLAAAGKQDGFDVTLDTHDFFELPDLAALIKNDLQQAGINVKLRVTDSGVYYDRYWLNSDFGITEYGHRGVPNVYLKAAMTTGGIWNAAHFENREFDRAVANFTAALDPQAQKTAATRVQQILLDETPVVIPYFYYFLTGVKANVGGVTASPMGHVELERAGFTA